MLPGYFLPMPAQIRRIREQIPHPIERGAHGAEDQARQFFFPINLLPELLIGAHKKFCLHKEVCQTFFVTTAQNIAFYPQGKRREVKQTIFTRTGGFRAGCCRGMGKRRFFVAGMYDHGGSLSTRGT